jgi:PAS domain S-box-containing protein
MTLHDDQLPTDTLPGATGAPIAPDGGTGSRHEAEAQHDELAQLYRTAPIGLALLDRDSRFLRVNERLAEINGLPVAAHLGRTLREVIPALADQTEALVRRIVATGEPALHIELAGETAARPGERRVWDESWYPLMDETGAVTAVSVIVEEVTAQRRVEARLRESEERLRALVTASSYVVYRMSPDWTEMRQLDGGGFLVDTDGPSVSWLETYLLPEDQPHILAAIGAAIAAKSMFELEHRVRRADGTVGWTHSRAIPLLDERGEIAEWFGAASDVTARKEAEAALRMSEARQAFLLQLSDALRPLDDAVEVQEVATRVLGAQLRVSRVFYGEVSEDGEDLLVARNYVAEGEAVLTGRYRMADFGPTLVAALRAGRTVALPNIVAAALSEAERAAYAALGIAAVVGVPLVKEGRFVAILNAHQSTAREWTADEIALIEETAERIWAAAERARAEAALRTGEERFRRLADAMPQVVWVADPSGTVTYYNARVAGFAGVRRSDEGTWDWQPAIHPDDLQATVDAWTEAARAGTPYAQEHRILMADGTYRWHLSLGVPVVDASGRVEVWYGTATDIHALKEAEEERRTLADALAHDLKNPLAGIKGRAQVLQRQLRRGDTLDTAALADHLAGIEQQVGRMTGLLDALQADAQAAAPPERRRTDLVALVRSCVADLRRANTPHRIELQETESAVTGSWDPDQLARVVGNLLENAVKYSPTGGVVAVAVAREEGAAVLRVRDTGRGIPAADLPHIFAFRRRGGNVGDIAGSGIGLASGKRIVEAHGGTIAVESVEGRGTTVTVRLPLGV